MDVRLDSLIQGAQDATGTVIIIDVFRCFTTAAVAFSRGAEKIVMVAEVDEALDLKGRGVGSLCVGEVGGKRPEGFDFGNSPTEMSTADLAGRTLIQSTRAGTVGVTSAIHADEVFGGSLVIAQATADAITVRDPEVVTVVAMGSEGTVRNDEDEQCALYLRNLLQERRPDPEAVRSLVLAGAEAQKYDDPTKPHFPATDRDMAVDVNRYTFAIRIRREDGLLTARAEFP